MIDTHCHLEMEAFDINRLLLSKLPDILDEKQKNNKVNNLLYEMSKKDNAIKNIGSDKKPRWVLV